MPKPPSWNEIRTNAAAFAAEWANETDENREAQTFWNEFLAVFGVTRRRVATFEANAQRQSTGGRGRIDVWWPGVLIAEHKSAGRSLADAEEQALDYLAGVDPDATPGVVITSDFGHMRVRDLDGDNEPFEFPMTDLVREIDRFGFIAGYRARAFTAEQEEAANVKAARLMGRLYEELARTGYTGHDASVLLTRLLFLLFGDDTGMWEKSLFSEFVETRTQPDGSDLGPQLVMLFQVLDQPVESRPTNLDEYLARFPFVNGGLFADAIHIPSFDRATRNELLTCCAFDWGAISPAVFGSLFQAVKSQEARRELGEHYTTERNILRVIKPLFLDELRARLVAARDSKNKLERLHNELANFRFFDPACGCGNFLVVAYREMRRLELDIMLRLRELANTSVQPLTMDVTSDLRVSLSQFHGIEIEEWPARIAETAMFLTDHQANMELAAEFGQAPDRLPIVVAANVVQGNATRMDWSQICPPGDDVVILSNPPFVGMSLMNEDQQADRSAVFSAFQVDGKRTGRLDYVACWYAKAVGYLTGTKARAGLVSTNSITQGEQARTMIPFLTDHGFVLDFAHRTFRWTSEAPGAAVVHVVIVGFSWGGTGQPKRIFDYPNINAEPTEIAAKRINFYLLDADDVAPAKRYAPWYPSMPTASKGSQPTDGNHLTVTEDDYQEVAADPRAAKYLRPYRQATEMLYGKDRWCLWLVDANPQDIHDSQILQRRLAAVAAERAASKTASVREQASSPALFTQRRQPSTRYLAMPEVSSENRDYIPGRFYDPEVIAGNKLIVWPDAPLWLFGYLQSAAFTQWVKAYAGRLKSDPSISPGLTYFTFPFVIPTGRIRERIEAAAQSVLDTRAGHSGATLAALYDPLGMPPDLRLAHRNLDAAIDSALGLRGQVSAGRRLDALLKRYLTLAAAPPDTT